MLFFCLKAVSLFYLQNQSDLSSSFLFSPLTLAHIDYAIFDWIWALAQLEEIKNLDPAYKKK